MVNATYSPKQQAALQDELSTTSRKLRYHETECHVCMSHFILDIGKPCRTHDRLTAEIESIEEALDYDKRDRDGGDTEDYSHYWYSDVTVNPHKEFDRWDELVQEDENNSDDSRQGVGRKTSYTPAENAWLEMFTKLGDRSGTQDRQAFQAALRVWFPRDSKGGRERIARGLPVHDVAIWKTYLTVQPTEAYTEVVTGDPDGTSRRFISHPARKQAIAECRPCGTTVTIQATAQHVVRTIQHALSHAPAHIQRGVEFFTDSEGNIHFELTNSTALTEDETLALSFRATADQLMLKGKQAWNRGDKALAHKLYNEWVWYDKAASTQSK